MAFFLCVAVLLESVYSLETWLKLQNSDNSAILKILFLLNMLANVLLSAEYPYRIFYKQSRKENHQAI